MLSTTSSLIFLFALATTVLACGPPVGNIYSKATFEFTILSPVPWSYSGASNRAKRAVITAEDAENDTTTTAEPANGMDTQAPSQAAASEQVNTDVMNAITETLKENSLPADSVNTTIKYTPLKTTKLNDDCQAKGAGIYAKYDGTIYYSCATPISMADQKGTIVIDSKTAIAEGQWKAIAVKVQDHLEKDSHVVFEDRLKVVFG